MQLEGGSHNGQKRPGGQIVFSFVFLQKWRKNMMGMSIIAAIQF